MTNPYQVLNLTPAATCAEIRARYLDLIRQFTPEQHPERFAEIRRAYELIGSLEERTQYHLEGFLKVASLDDVMKEFQCQSPVPRLKLEQLDAITKPT